MKNVYPRGFGIQSFFYSTGYRYYTLAKVGFAAAYLWYVWDFFRIHQAIWNGLYRILPDPAGIVFSGNMMLDGIVRQVAIFVSAKAMVWIVLLLSPVAAGGYLWGRYKWIQFALALWMSASMMALTCLVGVFTSTADIWLNYVFVAYALAALLCPSGEWEKCEPGFGVALWRENASLVSGYAWLIVLIEFTVYLFAGIHKLVDGWVPWTTGIALKNLAVDSSMREFVRGMHVPTWISLLLCYVTLFQRLVVPFGFYFRRWRLWSVIILGTMHVGYAILMHVNLFPLVGIASLLMVLPPRSSVEKADRPVTRASFRWPQKISVCVFFVWLLGESTRLTIGAPTPWENKLMIVPAWRMFADGGVAAGGKWKVLLETPRGTVDATDLALQPLPGLWRDRFYIDIVFHDLLNRNTPPGSVVDKLLTNTEDAYGNHQREQNEDPTVLNGSFELYRWKPNMPH